MSTRPSPDSPDSIHTAAAVWLARRDRGLTAAEQDEYLEWLREDPSHGNAVAKLDTAWSRMDLLAEWKPAHAAQPNPDLLAPARPWWRRYWQPVVASSLAAAAVLAAGIYLSRPEPTVTAVETAQAGIKVLPGPERLVLADGSVVELNAGGRIQSAFTGGERRVRLVQGEAHFAVTKNPARPFIVDAGAVSVRAVGTAFDVRRGAEAVEVLVTEGKVRLERPQFAQKPDAVTPLAAGQRAMIDLRNPNATPIVSAISAAEADDFLAWQSVRLELVNAALSDVVAEFNLRNKRQLIVGDTETAQFRLGGTFRTDNVDGFVRLIDAMGVKPEYRQDGSIVLRRER